MIDKSMFNCVGVIPTLVIYYTVKIVFYNTNESQQVVAICKYMNEVCEQQAGNRALVK